jgi:hypothetical protein
MADTTVQKRAEVWIIEYGLPDIFGVSFECRKLKLNWGGVFEFDAVSIDGSVIASVSTSSVKTAGNKLATAKIQKIKCDTLYLLHATGAKKRALVFSELDMLRHFEKEVKNGRFPKGIQLIHVALPPGLQREVEIARRAASLETSPLKANAL